MNNYLVSLGPALANHIWQSTAFGLLAWMLTLTLRRNQARVRYAIWLAASIKFLVPFSLLVSAGNLLPHPRQTVAPVVYSTMDIVEEPFAVSDLSPVPPQVYVPTLGERVKADLPAGIAILWSIGIGTVLFGWWNRWRTVSRSARLAVAATEGREREILRRLEVGKRPLALLMSAQRMEPGIFGLLHPVLLWPRELSARLEDTHIEAILAHELAHVRRRDNLTALLHMLVEAAFWFHPLVWWMERQMVREREQACDEAVVALGGSAETYAETYAESLLKTCSFCIEWPLPCVAGVTGADLNRRIKHIMATRVIHQLGPLKVAALGTLASLVIGVPLFIGAVGTVRAELSSTRMTFDAASVRVSKNSNTRAVGTGFQFLPVQFLPGGRLVATGMPLVSLITAAYDLPLQSTRLSFAPGVKPPQDNYDIEAVGPESEFPAGISVQARNAKLRLMLQSLLADRFHLRIRIEPREQPAYVLVVGKGRSKLVKSKKSEEECEVHEDCHQVSGGQGAGIHGDAVSISDVAQFVQSWTDKPVVDETGLKDLYNIQTEGWTPMRSRPPNPDGNAPSGGDVGLNDADRQTLFQVFEQLGLRMESKPAVIDTYVVESVEQPSSVDGAEVTQPSAPPTLAARTQVPANPVVSPAGSASEAAGGVVAKIGRGISEQIVSDTRGVDFSGYVRGLQDDVTRNWGPLASSGPASGKSGVTSIRLSILPGGKIGTMKLEQSSGDKDLDKAAWFAVTSEGTFPPLPSAFHGQQVELLLKFIYNTAVTEPSARVVPAALQVNRVAHATVTSAPSFEVASIRMVDAHTAAELQRGIGLLSESMYPTAHFFLHNVTLDFLIVTAYGVDLSSIQKDAGWMDSQLYDVDAKVNGDRPLSREEMRPLLQNLLAQRFNLAVHSTNKVVAGFELVVAKEGPKLKPAKEGEETHAQLLSNRLDAESVSAKLLAGMLMRPAGASVVDKTGLTGSYDVRLTFAAANDPNPTQPSLFTAVQEQLGLKLQPAKVPVDYLVIDHADRVPTDN